MKSYLNLIVLLFVVLVIASCTKTNSTTTSNTSKYIYCTADVILVNHNNDTSFVYQNWSSDVTVANAYFPNYTFTATKSSNSQTGIAGQAVSFEFQNFPYPRVKRGDTVINNKNVALYDTSCTVFINNTDLKAFWCYDGKNRKYADTGYITYTKITRQNAYGTFWFRCTDDSTYVQNGNFSVSW